MAHMLGPRAPLGIAAGDIDHRVANLRPAIAAHGGDMHEQLLAAALGLDETETLAVVPALQRAAPLHTGPQCAWALLQSIRLNCQVARISRPKPMRYQANSA